MGALHRPHPVPAAHGVRALAEEVSSAPPFPERAPVVRRQQSADRPDRRHLEGPRERRPQRDDARALSGQLKPSLREYDSPRHREPPLGDVAIQGRAAGVCHAALDRHASLAMTNEWVPVIRTWYQAHRSFRVSSEPASQARRTPQNTGYKNDLTMSCRSSRAAKSW